MEAECLISATETASDKPEASLSHSQSKLKSDLLSLETDDIFNLNSFNKEEYLVSTKSKRSRTQSKESSRSRHRRRRRRHQSSSSSSSLSKNSSHASSSRRSNKKEHSYSSSSNASSSDSRSRSSWSRSASNSRTTGSSKRSSSRDSHNSNGSELCHPKLKSKVVIVNTNQIIQIENDALSNNNNDNSMFNAENEWNSYSNNSKSKCEQYDKPKLVYSRMICTPPLPTSFDSEFQVKKPSHTQLNTYQLNLNMRPNLSSQQQTVVDNAMPYYYYRNPSDRSYCPLPVPAPILPPQFVKNMHSNDQESNFQHQFRPISPPQSYTDVTRGNKNSPLNQYQEISSTINQSEYYKHVPNVNAASDDSSNNNQKASLLNEENEEDLLSFRNHLQEQLKLKLFNSTSLEHANKNNKQENNSENNSKKAKSTSNSLNNSSFSSSASNQHNISPRTVIKVRKKKEAKERQREKRHHRHHHHHRHNRERKHSDSSTVAKSKSIKRIANGTNEENSENDESASNLRRSDRIKTIETIRNHHKVMKIAEKIKNHHVGNEITSSDQSETLNVLEEKNENIKEIVSDNLIETVPIKVKDRWRRYSEKDYDLSSPQTTFANPLAISQSTLEPNESNFNCQSPSSNLLIKPSNNFLNSPSSSVSGTSSPRAYKKILLNKAFNELAAIKSPNVNNQSDEANKIGLATDPIVPTTGFELIDENIYICKREKKTKLNKDANRMVCDCSTSQQERSMGITACGDDCLNRLLMIECGNNCPCEEYCANKNFKNKNNAPIHPFKTELKGWGLKTTIELKPNTFLIEYVGEVIDVKEFKKRFEKYADQNIEHFYFMSLQNDLFIDATRRGNISRYFNHSCDPNCETQKWTVNGQLRIGFFTRRPVSSDEELTFDYQYQTVGKKQQKCYCGTEKCRGYLGVSDKQQTSKGGVLDYIWEDDSSEDEDSDEVEDESDTSEDDEKLKHKKNKSSENQAKDYDLNRQIDSISSLKTKESILKLCQLMFRTENIQSRLVILNLLLNASSELSLHLFMDYHGLKLLWGWMLDIDNSCETKLQIECKIKIIKVLSSLTIKNRTTVEECKLLTMVKRWAQNSNSQKTNEKSENSSDSNEDKQIWIKSILTDTVEKIFQVPDPEAEELNKQVDELNELTKELYEKWNNLKQAFKIPKKQRFEERKEHERELNNSNHTSNNTYDYHKIDRQNMDQEFKRNNNNNNRQMYYHNQYQASFNNKRNINFNRFHAEEKFNRPQPPYYNQNSNSILSKEQRRQLFEEKVKQEEREAAARAAEQAAAAAALEAAQKEAEQQKELKWIFDRTLNQWIQCYMPVVSQESINIHGIADQNLMPPPNNLPSRFNQFDPSHSIQNHINDLNLSESHFLDLKQAVQSFLPQHESSTSSRDFESELKKAAAPLSPQHNVNSLKKMKNAIKKPAHVNLPPNWKCKKNKKGQIYYFNVKTRKSQWHFPRLKPHTKTVIHSNQETSKKIDESIVTTTTNEPLRSMTDQMPSVSESSTTGELSSTTNTNESASNTFKLIKDQFREKLSKLIIKLLEAYMKEDCKYGRIKSTDDFKHLARKFTHTIMEKELSRVTKLEELDLNKRIKIKAQEYITQYMNKFKSGYSRKNDLA